MLLKAIWGVPITPRLKAAAHTGPGLTLLRSHVSSSHHPQRGDPPFLPSVTHHTGHTSGRRPHRTLQGRGSLRVLSVWVVFSPHLLWLHLTGSQPTATSAESFCPGRSAPTEHTSPFPRSGPSSGILPHFVFPKTQQTLHISFFVHLHNVLSTASSREDPTC